MKKLIAISVVFALVAGAAFAVDVGATVIGTVNVLQGDTGKDANGDADKVRSSGGMNRVRIDGSGEANENFGGYFRGDSGGGLTGNAWWKPVDQVKILIGGNGGDGFIGKEGVTGWGFYQTATDTGVTFGGANVWGWFGSSKEDTLYGYQSLNGTGVTYRKAFFEQGDGQEDFYVFITPMDMLGINIILPFISHKGEEAADVFKQTIAQIDLKLEGIGNIALTYVGGKGVKDPKYSDDYALGTDPSDADKEAVKKGASTIKDANGQVSYWDGTSWVAYGAPGAGKVLDPGANDPATIFLYYGGSFGDLSIDFGFGYKMPNKVEGKSHANPIGIGLGVKYAMETLGVKFRSVVSLPMEEDERMVVLAEVMPYFVLGDNLTAFVSVGLGMMQPSSLEKKGDVKSVTGWHFNPYLVVGEEWGAKFLAGIKVWSDGFEQADGSKITNWAIPVALSVSF